jgi:hypothetical protein
MRSVPWLAVVALSALAMAVVTAPPMRGPKVWLLKFTHRWNPLPILGTLMDCQACMGFWAGAMWGWIRGYGFIDGMLVGGLVSLTTTLMDLLVDVLEVVILRLKK